MSKNRLLPFALLALSQSILAQQVPSAGSQMQQIPPVLIQQNAIPKIDVKPGIAPISAATDERTRLRLAARIDVNRAQRR
jgi:hypothetical protein